MKKIFTCLLVLLGMFCITGCEKVNVYKEGVYEATAVDTYNNENNIASAKVVVNASGRIESIYLDTTYKGSTKKALKDDYNMMKYNPNASGEWYVQVEKLEAAIIEHQGVDFLNVDSEGYVDSVSGCTIKVDALVEAATLALNKAK